MTWVVVVLVLILFALWSISTALSNLVKILQNKEMQANNNNNVNLDTSGIEEELQKIVKLMGGDEKFAAETAKHRKELKERLIKMIMYAQKKNEKEAKEHAEELYKKAELEEKEEDYSYQWTSIENWVKNMEKDQRNFEKYGDLLPKARKFLDGKETLEKNGGDMEKELGTDYRGREWLIGRLLSEKRLEKVEEYHWDKPNELQHYKVIEVQA